MNTTTRIIKSVNFNSNVIWLVIVLSIAIITGIAITDEKWLYFGVPLSPLIIYLCIHKPVIFPFGLYVLLLPFESALSVTGSSGGATLTKFLGVLTILVLSIKGAFENKLKKPDAASICLVLFVLYGALSVTWAIQPDSTLSILPTAVGLLIFYLIVASYKFQKNDFDTIKWCIIIGGFLSAFYSTYNYESTLSLESAQERATLSIQGREAGAATFAFSLIMPVLVCIQMMIERKKIVMKALFGVVIGVILLGIIITGTRAAMLGVGVGIITYILSLKQKITFVTISIVVGIILVPFIPDLIFERWGQAVESGGSGRLSIWYVGIKVLEKYWPIGVGLNNFHFGFSEFAHYARDYGFKYADAHNTYLRIFAELGIVGFTLMTIGIVKHYRLIKPRFNYYNNNHVMLKASLLAVLVTSTFGGLIWTKPFWLILMMIMIHKNVSEYK